MSDPRNPFGPIRLRSDFHGFQLLMKSFSLPFYCGKCGFELTDAENENHNCPGSRLIRNEIIEYKPMEIPKNFGSSLFAGSDYGKHGGK